MSNLKNIERYQLDYFTAIIYSENSNSLRLKPNEEGESCSEEERCEQQN